MIHLAAFVLSLVGFATLALAVDRQQREIVGRRFAAGTKARLCVSGAIALLLALSTLVAWQGWALGLVMFSGHTSLAAAAVLCCLVMLARHRVRASR